MLTPRVVLGRGGGIPAMLFANDGYLDDNEPFDLVGRTLPFAPAGVDGEAIFTAIILTTMTFEDIVTLFVTPSIDGVDLDTQVVVVPAASNSAQRSRVHELTLSLPYYEGAVEVMRTSPRGTWIDVRIESKIALGYASSTRQIIAGIVCESEVVRETQVSV